MRKFQAVTLCLFIAYGLVLLQRKKEFWPFSSFPMFSVAGKTWRRAVLRTVTAAESASAPCEVDFGDLPGRRRSPRQHLLNSSELSSLVAKSKWPLSDAARRDLARSFKKVGRHVLLLYEAQGAFVGGRTQTRFLLRAKIDAGGVDSVACSPRQAGAVSAGQ